jgi:hypothetical protein
LGQEVGIVRLFRFEAEQIFQRFEVVCDGCGWKTRRLYVIAEGEEEALELVKKGVFLCGECMAELLTQEKYEVKR